MKKRHSERLFDHYGSTSALLKATGLDAHKDAAEFYYKEFCTSTTLRQYSFEHKKYFEYFLHRLHLLGVIYMFDIGIPLVYKGYEAVYHTDMKLGCYKGYVKNHHDSDIIGDDFDELTEDFKNIVDFVIANR